MLNSETLKGTWGTIMLPVNSDESIDFERLSDEIDFLTASQLNGLYSNGTAGEFYNQTEKEFDRIHELFAGKCRKSAMKFQIGCCHTSPVITLERIKRTKFLNPDAFQVILPDWVKVTEEECLNYIQRIKTEAENIPLVLYNPPHAKSVLKPSEFAVLKNNIIGIKVAMGNPEWYEEMRIYCKNLSVFVPGHLLATGVKEKIASGSYSNIACLNPTGAQRWWNLIQSDLESALEIESRILKFFKNYILPFSNLGYSNTALDKILAAVGGWSRTGTRLRWPYKWIEESETERIREAAKRMIPEIMGDC